MSDGSVFVVFNRKAGRGRAARIESPLLAACANAGIACELEVTREVGDGTRAARAAAERGAGVVVAAGGDGTVNEVVEGLHGAGALSSPPPLAILPLGSGDDFAAATGAPRGLHQLVAMLRSGRTRRVDLGLVRWRDADGDRARVFCNGLGLGLEAEANLRAAHLGFLRGLPLYASAVAWALAHPPEPRLRMAWRSPEDEELRDERRCLMVAIGNGHRAGGGFLLHPSARPDDGLLDLCIVAARSRLATLRALPRVVRGKHLGEPGVRAERCRTVELESDEPFALHADGEVVSRAATHVAASLRRGALELLVPAQDGAGEER